MYAHFHHGVYTVKLEPTTSLSSGLHYFLRNNVTNGTIHIHYDRTNVKIMTLCIVKDTDLCEEKFLEKFDAYKHFIWQMIVQENTSEESVNLRSSLEWTFRREDSVDLEYFYQILKNQAWHFSENMLATIKTLFETRPVDYLL